MTISESELDIINQAKAIMEKYIHNGKKLCSSDDVKDYFVLHLGLYEYEVFGVLYLNSQNKVIAFEELFRGTINELSVYPREIVKQVLHYNAAKVILVHNHPSGDTKPSPLDIAVTYKIKNALALIDVNVLDHFIVAKNCIISMREEQNF